jgi:hypothetical protein
MTPQDVRKELSGHGLNQVGWLRGRIQRVLFRSTASLSIHEKGLSRQRLWGWANRITLAAARARRSKDSRVLRSRVL